MVGESQGMSLADLPKEKTYDAVERCVWSNVASRIQRISRMSDVRAKRQRESSNPLS